MRLTEFSYELPVERIAQHPIEPRDSARLLVDQGSQVPLHRHVTDLGDFLRDGDVLVVNDTKVIPARLRLARSTGGAAEVLLLEPLDEQRRTWEAMVRPAKKMQPNEELFANGQPLVRVLRRSEAGDTMIVELVGEGDPLALLAAHGEMPLPPYITTRLAEPGRYQTVYANEPASSAAPTAGLHLTPQLLESFAARGIETVRVELVVGLDTFKPVSVDDPRDHQIHSERYKVPVGVTRACAAARRVVAVGTTSVRALESAATLGAPEGRTRLFIHRPYEWKVVDALMTNFHMPRTTLLMMIDAFVGPRWRTLYEEALREEYRFLSFGDAMLLDRSLT
ncbi:MAG TPA: tRNA preQ1(34) S-adenosylmethionine ribosyltransferase-isomerase QueA [Ilumatobacteraceae bacterium]|nr:tRNA preQ1(34) S-adenosylmethionine ribosyltransferase-isomerase QueA [Ilumatobacteraceae bacterium]